MSNNGAQHASSTSDEEEHPIEPILHDAHLTSPAPPQPHLPYTFDTVTKYTVKELVFRPDCFDVLDESSNGVFSVKGKILDRSGEKTLFESDTEQRLLKMTENLNTFLQLMYMYDFRSKSVYTMRKKGFFPGFGRGTVYVWKGRGTDSAPFLQMNTSAGRANISIVDIESGNQLASMQRSMFGPRRLLTGADFYRVSVSAGVDVPFIIMLCVCADEQYTDFNR